MAITLIPVLIASSPVQVTVPSRAMVQVLIQNESGSQLAVDTGAGSPRPIAAGTQDVFDLSDALTITLTPSTLTTPAPIPPSSVAVLTFYGADERRDPRSYPVPVVRQAASYYQQIRLDQISVPSGQIANGKVIPVPLGIQSIGFQVGNGKPFEVFITGSPTGATYVDELAPGQGGPYVDPYSPTEDNAAQLNIDNTQGGGVTAVVSMIGYQQLFSTRPSTGPDPNHAKNTAVFAFATGSAGQIVITSPVVRIHWVSFTVLNTGTAAAGAAAQIYDGAGGTGTLKWNELVWAAVGLSAKGWGDDLEILCFSGTCTLRFDRTATGLFEAINVGWSPA